MRKDRPYPLQITAVACSSIAVLCTLQVQASGFQLIEQSVSGMGTAYAGSAAQAQDATTIYFNPAGLTHLKEPQAIAATHIVVPQTEFNEKGSTHVLGASLGAEEGGDAGGAAAIPNLYYARKLPNGTSFGIGINVPFGLSTEYNRNWIGRYHAVKSEVHVTNINPAIAFKATDQLSIGLGFNIQYIEAELSNAIDFGTINIVRGYGAPIGGPTNADGFLKLKGNDWSAGYNLGVLYDFNEQTRIGLHYRSKVKHTLEGDANFTVPGGGTVEIASGGMYVDTDLESTTTLPASLSASIYHDLNRQWAIMADVTWTGWSQVQELRFEFENPVQADGVTTLKWEDSYRYSVGVTHTPNDTLIYRVGVAYDETPVPNAHYRSPRVPGADRLWLAVGLGYKYSNQLSFDIGYAHLFMNDAKINKTATGEDASRGGLNGKYDASVDMLSAQLKWTFM